MGYPASETPPFHQAPWLELVFGFYFCLNGSYLEGPLMQIGSLLKLVGPHFLSPSLWDSWSRPGLMSHQLRSWSVGSSGFRPCDSDPVVRDVNCYAP